MLLQLVSVSAIVGTTARTGACRSSSNATMATCCHAARGRIAASTAASSSRAERSKTTSKGNSKGKDSSAVSPGIQAALDRIEAKCDKAESNAARALVVAGRADANALMIKCIKTS